MTAGTVTKAHLKRTAAELNRAGLARDRFAARIVEALAPRWDSGVPLSYRETWDRLDAEYLAAITAFTEARQ